MGTLGILKIDGVHNIFVALDLVYIIFLIFEKES